MMLSINRIVAIPYADFETKMARHVLVPVPTWLRLRYCYLYTIVYAPMSFLPTVDAHIGRPHQDLISI